ncbi:OmpA family protein [Fluviicola taffensis]|uniref:OmpA/MotB domain protein n=1 Tax=Fluviicola taffensis (strain DSM 16823 / NCIMB 13979 / RW262) TaxID=755732 RepID=F2IDV1_FLUTR|nr:OmpA family protein [Fluviicola taffensis]AEA44493.1 OmpA/MotB domain protein [Fluviicola taffensis DSM 16823]
MNYQLLIFSLIISFFSSAQVTGVWKGVLIKDGQKADQASIIYFDLGKDPISREDVTGKEGFAVRMLKVESKGKTVKAKQTTIIKKTDVYGNRWCTLNFDLAFVDSTGYLQGRFSSLECKGVSGKVICFKINEKISREKMSVELQSWRSIFVDDVKNGRKSKEIRDLERKNFDFKPIYFDYDKSDIRPEFESFLNRIVYVINSHTDLRVKVTGNTDADGSDQYNDGLSERRAEAIIAFFVKAGLKRDRIVIDFKGEKNPVSDNNSDEGKQLNRRVDFEFI